MKRKEIAVNYFKEGKNCAQSVLLSFSNDLNLDKEVSTKIASGFGAGMGRLQKTCGALTGSFMVVGYFNSLNIKNPEERKTRTNQLIQELEHDFNQDFGYSDCAILTDADLNTEEGQQKFSSNQPDINVCEKCVAACTSWLDNKLMKDS